MVFTFKRLKGGSRPLKKLLTQGQSQSRGLGWLQEKVEQLLKERQEHLSRLREQQQQPWPMPPGLPEMSPPPPHELFHEQGETPQRNHPRHESPGASQRHESPRRHGMNEFNPTESPPPALPWAEEWPDVPRSQDGGNEPREPEMSRNVREWLLYEWDFEDIPPPQQFLEKRGNTQKQAPHLKEWPPMAQWDAHRGNRSAPDWEEFPRLTDERKEAERAKVNTAKSRGRRTRKQRHKKR
jgi:hypothetical protein